MKLYISILAIVLGSFSTLIAQNSPRFQFENETIDYGEIKKGSDGVRTFKFKNVGDAPLLIENVYSSCGCTIPEWTKTAVPPGETGEIQVKYDTSRPGPIRRTISIYSNAAEPIKALKIKGKVLESDM